MSTMQRISLIGFYNYDPTLFSGLILPEGYDKATFINSLLLEHGEKLVLYTDPDFMKSAINVWSGKWQLELERLYIALTAEYNPIHNYDRYEKIGDDETVTMNAGHKATDSPDFTTENKISADNSSEYQPDNQSKTTGKAKDLSETSNAKTTRDYDRDAHLYGNIGVTTNQQMIESEIKMRTENNLYGIACQMFANELLIGIF